MLTGMRQMRKTPVACPYCRVRDHRLRLFEHRPAYTTINTVMNFLTRTCEVSLLPSRPRVRRSASRASSQFAAGPWHLAVTGRLCTNGYTNVSTICYAVRSRALQRRHGPEYKTPCVSRKGRPSTWLESHTLRKNDNGGRTGSTRWTAVIRAMGPLR